MKKYSNAPVYCISNAINTDLFKLNNPIDARKAHTIVFHYRNNAYKGGKYAIEIVKKLKVKYPDLQVTIVSSQEKDENIPGFCNYVYEMLLLKTSGSNQSMMHKSLCVHQ